MLVPFMILGYLIGYFYNFIGYIGIKICDVILYLEYIVQNLECHIKRSE